MTRPPARIPVRFLRRVDCERVFLPASRRSPAYTRDAPTTSEAPSTTMELGAPPPHRIASSAVSHERRKIEGRVTPVLCNLSLRVRVRPTATARRRECGRVSVTELFTYTCNAGWTEREGEDEGESETEDGRRRRERVYARMEITNGEGKTNGANGEKQQLLELAARERHARNGAG